MEPETIKVKPWGDGQGDFVVINKDDFNPQVQELFDDGSKKDLTVAQLRDALTAKGIAIPDGAKKSDLQDLLDAKSAKSAS